MLHELTIKNFRIFEDFHIEGLQRVNLIAGKNNTGKTVLLEALRIWAAKGDVSVVNHSLEQRKQFKQGWDSSYDALFNRKSLQKGIKNSFILDLQIRKRDVNTGELLYDIITKSNVKGLPPIRLSTQFSIEPYPKDQAVFVPFCGMYQKMKELWDKIALTDLEDDVIKILQETVEPRLVRLDLSYDLTKVRLKGENEPLPIQSLGDGVQRMLLIALSLVNAKGKLLLIDEFEAGLHHTVQEKLWAMLFHYCREWDIQAFITTHSDDAVRTFFLEAAKPENRDDAFFFRLQFDRQGNLEAIPYDLDRLEHALDQQIEIR